MLLQFFRNSDVLKQCPLYLYPDTLVVCSLLGHTIDINLSMMSTSTSIDLTPSTVHLGYHKSKDDKVELMMLHYKCPPSDDGTSLKKLTRCRWDCWCGWNRHFQIDLYWMLAGDAGFLYYPSWSATVLHKSSVVKSVVFKTKKKRTICRLQQRRPLVASLPPQKGGQEWMIWSSENTSLWGRDLYWQ
jgi:hypothetical protein